MRTVNETPLCNVAITVLVYTHESNLAKLNLTARNSTIIAGIARDLVSVLTTVATSSALSVKIITSQ